VTTADPARNDFDPGAAAAAKRGRAQQALLALSNSWLFVFLLLLIGWFWLTTPPDTFLSHSNLTQIALSTSEVVLLAIGQTFVIVTAGIDLSIGGIVFLSGVCGGEVMLKLSGTTEQVVINGQYPHASLGIALGVLVCVLTGAVCGLGNGLAITKLKLPPFIVTLGMLGITFGLGEVIDGGSYLPAPVPPGLSQGFGAGKFLGIFYPVWVAIVCLVVAHIAFVYTRFGRYTRAVGSNEEAARRAGISVDWHVMKVYTLAGLLAGVAAVVDLAIYTNTTAVSHRTDNLSAISAVVIGGTSLFGGVGSVLMSAVGAFVPTVLQNGLVIKGVQPFWQEVVVGATIIFAVYLDQLRRRRIDSS
jgi:ribose transport system permease protein